MSREPIVVVGSGASGAHFASALIEQGRRVVMLDVGHVGHPQPLPEATVPGLREGLSDPWDWFLGQEREAMILPLEDEEEYYGFPPAKEYVFRGVEGQGVDARGFAPLLSFARGGLAQAWTGGSYPFSERELEAFPFGEAELLPYYTEVAQAIGISGTVDDLAEHFPVHDGLQAPVELDAHAQRLLSSYERKRESLISNEHVRLGRARLAVLTSDRGARGACDLLGRCLWGCPRGSLYTPSHTIAELMEHDLFELRDGLLVTRFETDGGGRVHRVHAKRRSDGRDEMIEVGTLVLAAGTLPTARIVLESIAAEGEEPPILQGLMDNRQLLMPFVNVAMLGRSWEPASYQYHQLAFGLDLGGAADYVHGLVTTLKTALIHPVAPNLPFSMRAATRVFRDVHGALGLVNVNFSDGPRSGNTVRLDPERREGRLVVDYAPAADEERRVRDVSARFRRVLRKLGCIAPKGMAHLRPMGASVHYAGTFPMGGEGVWATDAQGRSRAIDNLYFADGSTFPWLPAKNLTLTLMANARRMARTAF